MTGLVITGLHHEHLSVKCDSDHIRATRFEVKRCCKRTEPPEKFPMKRLMISGFAAVALLAAATTMLWSHAPSIDRPVAPAAMMPSQAVAGVNTLPIEEFEDMSLVYSTVTKR